MPFQKCPVCNGSGKLGFNTNFSAPPACSPCQGTGIIDERTGLPPYRQTLISGNTTVVPDNPLINDFQNAIGDFVSRKEK